MLWGIQYILSQNIDRAGNMNLLATIAKIIGFTMFIVITLFIFNASNFGDGQTFMNEAGQSISLGGQINSAAIATLGHLSVLNQQLCFLIVQNHSAM